MKVLTFDNAKLDKVSKELASLVARKTGNGDVSAVVSIRTGGVFIGKVVYEDLRKNNHDIRYIEVSCRRPSTRSKKKYRVDNFLRKIPTTINNMLRNIESFLSTLKTRRGHDEGRTVEIEPSSLLQIQSLEKGVVLVIDDAIDSGVSMKTVCEYLRTVNNKVDYQAGVLTVTQSKPQFEPDYQVFDRVLLRFPWSADYKGSKE